MMGSLSSSVLFPKKLYSEIISHARSVYPEECCGLVASDESGGPVRVIPMTNTLHSPVRYQMDPKEQFSVGKALRKEGLALWGIYHSHPMSDPVPSVVDIRMATYPDLFYLLTSLTTDPPPLRLFTIREGSVREFSLDLVEASP